MLQNFRVIMKYNPAEAYALAIGHFADRLRGGAPFVQPWPRQERVLSRAERLELQQLLAQRGFYRGTPDGQFGGQTREALRGFQASIGAPADGFASSDVLERLQGAAKQPLPAPKVTLKNTFRPALDGGGRCPVYGAKSARLRPDSAIIADRLTIHCDRAGCRSQSPFSACSPRPARWSRWRLRSRCWSGSPARPPRSSSISADFGGRRRGRRRSAAVAAAGSAATSSRHSSSSSRRRKRRAEDFSRAPPPAKRDTVPERNVLVLGDAMADWLAYGLEDAYAEQPDMGVIRKHKTVSGLIKYQPKGEPADWAAAAKGILATEKPDAIVVMLGLNDRVAMREPVVEKSDKRPTRRTTRRTPAPSRMPSPDATAQTGWRSRPPPSPTTSRSTPNCRRTMPPTTPMRRRSPRRKRARARRTAFMSFARSAGSSSTPRRSRR